MSEPPSRQQSIKVIGLALYFAAGGRDEDAVQVLLSRDRFALDPKAAPWFAGAMSAISAEVADVGRVEAGLEALQQAGARGDADSSALTGRLRAIMGDDAGAIQAFEQADEQGAALGALGCAAVLLREGEAGIPRAAEALERAADRGSPAGAAMLHLVRVRQRDRDRATAAKRRSRELRFDWAKLPKARASGTRGVVARGLRTMASGLGRFTGQS